MPLPALAVALMLLGGSVAFAAPAKPSLGLSPSGTVILAFDDEVYGDRDNDDDDDDFVRPDDHDYSYGDDEDDDRDSAHGPDDDDDDGWDVDPLNRSERA